MCSKNFFAAFFAYFLVLPLAAASNIILKITRPTSPEHQIDGLSFDSQKYTAPLKHDLNSSTVPVTGHLNKKDYSLLIDRQSVALLPDPDASSNPKNRSEKRFQVSIKPPLTPTDLKLIAVGPLGEIKQEVIRVESIIPKPKKILTYSASLGFSSVRYLESFISNYDALLTTGKIGISATPPESNWDFGVNAFVTLLPISSSQPNTAVRFLGANFRIGYAFINTSDWRFSLQTGMYYTSMFVTNDAFGVKDLMGPQIFPVITRTLNPSSAISGYFKLSPIAQDIGLDNIDNREIAAGLSYRFTLKGGQIYSVGLDVSQLSLAIENIVISSQALSLSVGFVW